MADNRVTAGVTGVTLSHAMRGVVHNNSIANPLMGQGIAGIAVGKSNEALVTENTITFPSIGILITSTVRISVTANSISSPSTAGIILSNDQGGQVHNNTITNNIALGIHYQEGVHAVLSENTVDSTPSGIGIRLGEGASNCPVRVDDILVENNTLIGGLLGIEVLCDVGTHTLNGN